MGLEATEGNDGVCHHRDWLVALKSSVKLIFWQEAEGEMTAGHSACCGEPSVFPGRFIDSLMVKRLMSRTLFI